MSFLLSNDAAHDLQLNYTNDFIAGVSLWILGTF